MDFLGGGMRTFAMSQNVHEMVAVPWHQPGPTGEGHGAFCSCLPLPPQAVSCFPSLWSPQTEQGDAFTAECPCSRVGRTLVPSLSLTERGYHLQASSEGGCPSSELIPAASLALLLLCCLLRPPSWAAVSLLFFTEHMARAAGAGSPLLQPRVCARVYCSWW